MMKMYSAKLVKDTYRVGDNNYRVVKEQKDSDKYALLDIRNGGTVMAAVSMEDIMNFIGDDYELVTAVATYETPLSLYAHYILPQTVDMWKKTWQDVWENEGEFCRKALKRKNVYDLDFIVQDKNDLKLLNNTNDKIGDIFEEFKYLRDTIFRKDLAEDSFEDIVKLLPNYKREESGHYVIKRINEQEYFVVTTSNYDNDDNVEYDIDEGYGEYLQVKYCYSDGDYELNLNLSQRHHYFSFMWV